VRQLGPGVYQVELAGRAHRVDAFRHDYGTISLLVDTQSYSVQLDRGPSAVKVHLRDNTYPLEILDERRLRLRRTAGRFTVEGKQVVASPLPGKVVKLLARAGETVREGQGLLVVEAMEMENELRSPKDGRVTELAVVEGQAVEAFAKLAVVE
jgi:biotin carboxyl carrier protein